MQRSPLVSPPAWSFAVLCNPHFRAALGTRISSPTNNCFRDSMLTHQRYFADGAAENTNQANEAQVISRQQSTLVFKYHAGDDSQAILLLLLLVVTISRRGFTADMSSGSGASGSLRALMNVDAVQAASTAAVLGVVFHNTFLRVVEVEAFMYTLVAAGFLTLVGLFAVHLYAGFAFTAALARVTLLSTSFNVAVLVSIGIYRFFFHRLRKFPGPPLAKLSRFYSAYKASRELKYFKQVGEWNEEYGDFIRTGEYGHKDQFIYCH